MLSILILSKQGEGYELIDRIRKEGHIAKLWIETPAVRKVYQTLLHEGQIVDRYEEHLELADLVISTSARFGGICDRVRANGRLALGGGIQDFLVHDSLMKESALKLVTAMTTEYIMVGAFDEHWEGLFEAVVHDRFLEGNRGPVTEGMGCVVWKSKSKEIGIESMLQEANFKGFLGLNMQARTFFNPIATCLFPAMMECIKGSVTHWLMSLASGKFNCELIQNVYGISSRVGYLEPLEELKLVPEAEKHFWRHYEPGSFGYFTAVGADPREARRRVLRSIENNVPRDCVYRRDIGDIPCQ